MTDMLVPDADRQSDLFGDVKPTPRWQPGYMPDPARVRRKMEDMIEQLRVASEMPWTPDRLAHRRTVFPQMSCWLPDDEAHELCEQFDAELSRLEQID